MKKLFFAMLTLVALASCSKDEVVQLNQDEIKFSVVAENATKAADVYCNNNPISTFGVWARVETETSGSYSDYIGGSGDVVSGSNANGWTSSVNRYWPEKSVHFYAVAGMFDRSETNPVAKNVIKWNAANNVPATIEDYTINSDVTKQDDLLYAYEVASKSDASVNLNFRHALSQIVFNAKNEHPNLYIEISKVEVCGLVDKGTFTYPSAETTTNNSDKDNPHKVDPTNPTSGVGTWTVSEDEANKTYSVTTSANLSPKTAETASVVDLTTKNDENKEFNSNAMLLLPQSQSAYGLTTGSEEDAAKGTAYFKITCKIYNVADNVVTPLVKTEVYDGAACIPFSFTWEPGKKYIYTFVFGDKTNGGVEPDEDGKPDLDNPVLVNIGYTISIDEFVPVPATGNWTTDGTTSSDQTTGDPDPATAA